MCNSLVLSKGLLYVSTMLKEEAEGIVAFVVPTCQHHTALNGVHRDMGYQGQQTAEDVRPHTRTVLVAHDGG